MIIDDRLIVYRASDFEEKYCKSLGAWGSSDADVRAAHEFMKNIYHKWAKDLIVIIVELKALYFTILYGEDSINNLVEISNDLLPIKGFAEKYAAAKRQEKVDDLLLEFKPARKGIYIEREDV